jgi:hypothetical protein
MESNCNVFINCPFDPEYSALFDAILFTVFCCGFKPRCAYEAGDEDRLNRICSIIEECDFGIHDLSRTELNAENLPRFNMPLELGIFIGAKRYGGSHQRRKHYLILDTEKYRYQKFISDLGGQDPKEHGNSPDEAIMKVRSWLKSHSKHSMPGATAIQHHYSDFLAQRPALLLENKLTEEDAEYSDITSIMEGWVDFHLC